MLRLLLLSFFISLSTANAKVLIVTVAKVKNHVITSREVDIHTGLNNVLGKRFEALLVEDQDEQVIREWILFFEASTFYNSKVSKATVDRMVGLAQKRLSQTKNWQALAVSQKELRVKLERRLEADRLYLFKKKSSVLPVGKSEIETEYNQNRIRYGNLKFEEVKEKIRKAKTQANLKKRMEQWFSVLEKKYKVQRFSKFIGD